MYIDMQHSDLVKVVSENVTKWVHPETKQPHSIDDKPAMVFDRPNGCKSERWFNNGVRHRIGGPAMIDCEADGTVTGEWWIVNGKMHREDGPSVIVLHEDGTSVQVWHLHDKLHRLDGPAVTNSDGSFEWWIDGQEIQSNEEFRILAGVSEAELASIVLKYGQVR